MSRHVRRLALLGAVLIGLAGLAVPAGQARPSHPRTPHVHKGTAAAAHSAEQAATRAVSRVAGSGDGWTSPARNGSRTYYPSGSSTPFTESNEVVEKDLELFETVLAAKEVLAGFRQVRHVPISDRIGHRLCTVALWPTLSR